MIVNPHDLSDEEMYNLLKKAVLQALDDMGDDGHCVCPYVKRQLQNALIGKYWDEEITAEEKDYVWDMED